MSIMEYNGGSVVAMIGKDCVAIASDLRLGQQAIGVAMNFEKVFPVNDKLYYGLPGLATDVYTLREQLRFRVNMYRMKEEREITPKTFTHLLSSTLYEKRFGPYFLEPVVAGLPAPTELDPNPKPFISTMDTIGCITTPKDFAVAGTAQDKLYGMAEGLWEPDLLFANAASAETTCLGTYFGGNVADALVTECLDDGMKRGDWGQLRFQNSEPEDLFETISQTLLNAVDRDALSGWGAIVHIITHDKVITRQLRSRMD